MRYAFIEVERAFYPVRILCHILEVSRSGFYAWNGRSPSRRARENRRIVHEIRTIHRKVHKRYGSPRMHRELVDRGFIVGRHRTARLMRTHGIRARSARKYRVTTDSVHAHPTAENLLARDFEAAALNRKWSSDITYIPTREGWLYLAVVLDLYSRRVVGWAVSRRLQRRLVLGALEQAIRQRRPEAELIHHSDRGSQYASDDYQRRLRALNIACSMSRKGDCWDNAVVESFFATLKKELVHGTDFRTRDQARSELFEYIELFYNRERRHSKLGFISPVAYENMLPTAA
jgi:transposase InsO family protein